MLVNDKEQIYKYCDVNFDGKPIFVGIWSWLADKLHFILSYEAGFFIGVPYCISSYPSRYGEGRLFE